MTIASPFEIRPIRASDCAEVARLIRSVMPEFGARGPGFAINDPEVDDMFGAYDSGLAAYFVVVAEDGEIVGAGGYAPLEGGAPGTCELRKMYFLPKSRGRGLGQEVLDRCLDGAARAGFTRMYLETLPNMEKARALYEKNGFVRLERREGATGHFGCDVFYARALP